MVLNISDFGFAISVCRRTASDRQMKRSYAASGEHTPGPSPFAITTSGHDHSSGAISRIPRINDAPNQGRNQDQEDRPHRAMGREAQCGRAATKWGERQSVT